MKLLKFQAEWCGPCKMLTKTMETLTFPYEVQVIDIDVDNELSVKYGIRSVPTLILLDDDGQVQETQLGMVSVNVLKEKFHAE